MDWITTSTILHDLKDPANESAWRHFVHRFRRPVASFARKLGVSHADAEDVAQETLLAFLETVREGRYERERGRLSHWLFGIAYRQALRQRRRDARPEYPAPSRSGSRPFLDAVSDEDRAADLWNRTWDWFLVRECMDRVRREFHPDMIEAFSKVVVEERTPAEAAAELDVPVKSVYNAKHRILKRIRELREDLEAVDVTGGPGA